MRARAASVAERRLSEPRRAVPLRIRMCVRYRLTPAWLKVLAVFLASRAVTTALLLHFAARQPANPWTEASPGYFDFATIWDGHWYYIIAVVGYPAELPLTEDGHVGESAWAFMPVYPGLVRVLMLLTGLDFGLAAVLVSVGFGYLASLMLFQLLALRLPAETALFAVALFCFGPLSPMLQVAYAESLHAFLLATALYLLLQRRYGMLLPVIAVMALTRPSGLAFALALGLHVVWRWWHRIRDPFPLRERLAAVGATAFSLLMGVAWPLIAAVVTGSLTAYTDTELAWRAPYVGYGELAPFAGWIQATGFWASWWQLPQWLLLLMLVLLVAAFAVTLFLEPVRRLGVDLRLWAGSYALYLLAVFFPQSSTFRLLLPLFPLLGALALVRPPLLRLGLVVLGVAGQFAWLDLAWWVDGTDWTPP